MNSSKSEQPMQGKTCIVTGANTGIGKATAEGLARLGATLVMVCRDRDRGEAALAELQAITGSDSIELLLADLTDQAAIREFVERFQERYDRLDVLINNAGGIFGSRSVSVDGIEMTLALNLLAPFLLTNLLLDSLEAGAPSRVVNVSSRASLGGSIDLDDLQSESSYSGTKVYGNAKLAEVLFTEELARRVSDRNITANSLHPGVVATEFGKRDGAWWLRGLVRLAKPFLINSEKGARTSIYLASSPEVESVSGEYFADCAPAKPSQYAGETELARELWTASERLTRLDSPVARTGA